MSSVLKRMPFVFSLVFLNSLLGLACASNQKVPEPVVLDAPRLFYGPDFHTDEGIVKAIATDKEGTITAFFKEMPKDTKGYEAIAIPGKFAVAGLHDAHIHPIGIGREKDRLNLRGVRSGEQIRKRVESRLKWRKNTIVYGRGWDQSLFKEKVFPNKSILEGLSEKPILLRRVDGHALLANDAAIKKAGIDKNTKDPVGGKIMHDENGELTGIFIDNAIDLILNKMPKPSTEDYKRWIEDGLYACADNGLTAVHDMGFPIDALKALKALDDADELPIRVFLYLDGSDERAYQALTEWKFSKMVSMQGVKLYADGAMGSRGAALLSPYSDDNDNHGLLLTPPALLKERIANVHAQGFQSATHAIGDRGVRTLLDAIEDAQKDGKKPRHRVEHAQLVSPEDFLRFKPLGVIASMQPTHATSDMRWAKDRVGEERLAGAYAWRTMLEQGIPLAFGSDAPVESHRVRYGVWAAVTRQDRQMRPKGGWISEQKLTIDETLDAFSKGAAYAVGREADLGQLKVGYALDVSIFDREGKARLRNWLNARSTAVIVAGRVLFRNADDNVKQNADEEALDGEEK